MDHPVDFLIAGGGIFGLTAAVTLAKRGHEVGLVDAGNIPNHLAASTDVTKAVRMEYGADEGYFAMAEASIAGWHAWNEQFDEALYHEVGFLMLCSTSIEDPRHHYEASSLNMLLSNGYTPLHLRQDELRDRFPAVDASNYPEAIFNAKAGYVRASRVVEHLLAEARALGVTVVEHAPVAEIEKEGGRVRGIRFRDGRQWACGHLVVAVGACTSLLVPEPQGAILSTGHPVFWLKPEAPTLFKAPKLAVFAADISNTGWYGFPYLEKEGIVKVARHADGLVVHPEQDDRQVTDEEVATMRDFLSRTFPQLSDAPLVFTRRCLYADTFDGHFWVDQHPEIEGLTVSTGGSGHGLKMAPVLGDLTADIVLGLPRPDAARFRWRRFSGDVAAKEDARYMAT